MKKLLKRAFAYIVSLGGASWKTKLWFLRVHRFWPNLERPLTFSEKIAMMKLSGNHAQKVVLSDKVLVKQYVAAKLSEAYITPTLWHGRELPPAHHCTWPTPFVIKANHGSSMNYFVRSPSDFDWPKIRGLTDTWLARDWPDHLCEEWYNKIERQLLVEPLIGGGEEDLPDYKIFVFSGCSLFIQVDSDRFTNHTRSFYDTEWNRLSFEFAYPMTKRLHPKPAHLSQMLEAAETLGSGFDFVRADFFDLPEGPKFGELTFAPEAGLGCFKPRRYDALLGQLWSDATDIGIGKDKLRARASILLR